MYTVQVTRRNSSKRRFLRFTRPASTRIHEVCEPAESFRFVDGGRTFIVRLGLRANLVRDLPRQRIRIGKRIDENDAGEIDLAQHGVGRVRYQLFFVSERWNSTSMPCSRSSESCTRPTSGVWNGAQ